MEKRYEELDALRGIAALLVVLFHFTLGRPDYNHVFKLGTTGVDLFFVISGFVIFMSLQKVSRGIDFVINRVSRLYPTYWASVSFTFLLISSYSIYKGNYHLKDLFISFIGNLSMFQFYLGIPDLDGPYWSMIIELIFYISMLLLFQLKLLKHLNTIGVVMCATIVVFTLYFHDAHFVKTVLWWMPLFQFWPLFFAGTIFYKIYLRKGNPTLNYLIIVFCLLCQLLLFPYVGRSNGFINWSEYSLMLGLYFSLFTLFVNNQLSFIVNKVTLFLGKISYALYLTHQYVSLSFVIPLFYEKLGINFWIVAFCIDLPIIVGIASLITYRIEIPYSKRMREKLRAIRSIGV